MKMKRKENNFEIKKDMQQIVILKGCLCETEKRFLHITQHII
jgi:hypothetical protein